MQGYHRGFYNNMGYQIRETCMNREFVSMVYYYGKATQFFSAGEFVTVIGLIYNMWYMFEYECEILDHFYDLSQFCFDHDCNPEQLL